MALHRHILIVVYLLNNLGMMLGLLATTRSKIKSAKTTGDRAFAVAAPVLWDALLPSPPGLLITLLHSRNNSTEGASFLGKHIFRLKILHLFAMMIFFFSSIIS